MNNFYTSKELNFRSQDEKNSLQGQTIILKKFFDKEN